MRLLFTKFFSVLLFLLFASAGLAQKNAQLSNDTVKFISDLNKYFDDNTSNRIESETYMRTFTKYWEENYIAGYYKEAAIKALNTMAIKHLKPLPYMTRYLTALYMAIEKKKYHLKRLTTGKPV